VEKTVA